MINKKGYTTKSLHTSLPQKDAYNALHMPVYDGVAYEFESAQEIEDTFTGKKPGHVYSRTSNPTVEYFESKLKEVSGAHGVMALSSGMAAISTAILTLVEKGGNIVSSNHLFGHTYAFFKETLPAWGIEVRFVDMSNTREVEAHIDKMTRVLFFETITNPQLEIIDIAQLSVLARQKKLVVVADSTITPPYVFDSSRFGVDIEVMSTTKFISGGATAVGGAILDNGLFDWEHLPALSSWHKKYGKGAFMARVRKEIFRHLGSCMTAHTAHYLNIGLDVLALRVDRCVTNCMLLGDFFKGHSRIKAVNYPGLTDNTGYELSLKQFSSKPGAVMTIDLESKEKCDVFINQLQVVRRATNLNDNKSLIIHPWTTIYAEFSDEEKTEMGIRDTMLRLSVGIEDVEDLIADFTQALTLL